MTAALFDTVRALVGFALGYATARTTRPCPVCGHLTTGPACGLCTPIINPRMETR